MEFAILGPLAAYRDGHPVALAGSQVRMALAALLLEANHVVSVGRLVEVLWEAEPPAKARRRVQNCISDLRGVLTLAGAGDVIRTDSSGYSIRLGWDELDLTTFEAGVDQGLAYGRAGRPEAAVERLRSALAVWRGPALAGIGGGYFESASARLNERRLAVVESCIDYELEIGRTSVISELIGLIGEHPFRERFIGQLMLAYYRSGRVAEAVEAYRDVRIRLAEELGLDPGRRLAELHEAILRNDPALLAEDAQAVPRLVMRPAGRCAADKPAGRGSSQASASGRWCQRR
jgi:DNA-binding SARP family transcriptional activator